MVDVQTKQAIDRLVRRGHPQAAADEAVLDCFNAHDEGRDYDYRYDLFMTWGEEYAASHPFLEIDLPIMEDAKSEALEMIGPRTPTNDWTDRELQYTTLSIYYENLLWEAWRLLYPDDD